MFEILYVCRGLVYTGYSYQLVTADVTMNWFTFTLFELHFLLHLYRSKDNSSCIVAETQLYKEGVNQVFLSLWMSHCVFFTHTTKPIKLTSHYTLLKLIVYEKVAIEI